jgi:ribosome-binding factor A
MKSCSSIAAVWLLSNTAESFTLNAIGIHNLQIGESIVSTQHTPIRQSASTCTNSRHHTTTSTSLHMAYGKYNDGRSSSRYASNADRTKRQSRVGHVVRSELATILHNGSSIKNDDDPIEDELRRRINIVHADVSPDLRQARVTVSVMAGKDKMEDVIAKRRAYAWLVQNTKSIRHSLAQRMKHMKASPDVTFVQVDVGAAVDVMQLIEKVSKGYKRDDVLDMGYDDDEFDEEDGWIDEADEGEGGADDDEGDDYDEEDWEDFDDEEGILIEMNDEE